MNNSVYLSDVIRINEIMGIETKPLIMEQAIPAIIKDVITNSQKSDIQQMAKRGFEDEVSKMITKPLIQFSELELSKLINKLDFNLLANDLISKVPQLSVSNRIRHYDRYIKKILLNPNQTAEFINIRDNKILKSDVLQRITNSTEPIIVQIDKSLGNVFLNDFIQYFKTNHPDEWNRIDAATRTSIENKITNKMGLWGDILDKCGLTVQERLLLTDKLWYRETRANIQDLLVGTFKKTDELYNRLNELLESVTAEAVKDSNFDISKYKAIDVLLENILKTKKQSKDGIYYAIQRQLQDKSIPFEKISSIMQSLKKYQPLDNYPTWLEEFIDKSYLVKIFKTKGLTPGQKISNTLERTTAFMTIGNARKTSEYYNQFIKGQGKVKYWSGALKIYAYLQFLSKIVYPSFLALCYSVYVMFEAESKKNPKTWKERAKGKLFELWNKIFIVQKGDFSENHKFLGMTMNEGDLDVYNILNPTEQWWNSFVEAMDSGNKGAIIDIIDNGRNRIDTTVQQDSRLRAIRDSVNNHIAPVIDSAKNELNTISDKMTKEALLLKYPCINDNIKNGDVLEGPDDKNEFHLKYKEHIEGSVDVDTIVVKGSEAFIKNGDSLTPICS